MLTQTSDMVDWLEIVRAEYEEMPGLRLTGAQAQRLWGLDALVCAAVLGMLVDAKFLGRTRDGVYFRKEGIA